MELTLEQQAFYNNVAHLWLYKSNRKNATIVGAVDMRHLITKSDNRQLTDDKIMSYFITTIEYTLYFIKQAKQINVRCWYEYGHITQYKNANGDNYEHVTMLKTASQRESYYSFEQLINHIYRLFLIVYPYSKLDIQDIYNNSSIKYFINQYYNK